MLVPFAPLGCKRIRSVSLRWRSFRNLKWSQLLTSVPNWILHPQLSFRYDKWLSLRNEYDLHFEMRICTCVIQPFGSLQVVIRFSEWQAAGSRIRQLQTSESRCQNYPFEMINDCLFEMIYDFHFEMSDSDHNHFEMMYVLSFRNDRAKFSYRGLFSSGKTPCILVTKIPPEPHVFVHRFFRSDCPLAAWK